MILDYPAYLVCLIYNFNSLFSLSPIPIVWITDTQTAAERLRRGININRFAWGPPYGTFLYEKALNHAWHGRLFTGPNGLRCTTGTLSRGSSSRFQDFKAVAMDIPRETFSSNDCCVW